MQTEAASSDHAHVRAGSISVLQAVPHTHLQYRPTQAECQGVAAYQAELAGQGAQLQAERRVQIARLCNLINNIRP